MLTKPAAATNRRSLHLCVFAPAPQVIEKAYKKLRLDALVIQQGRLVESTKGVNKDDLLSMVRCAALCPLGCAVPACVLHGPVPVAVVRCGLHRRAGLGAH